MHPDIAGRDGSDREWDVSVSKADLETLMSIVAPELQKLAQVVEDVYLWTIIAHEPIRTITKGRVAAIGDAVHPHLPYYSQGVSSGLEDVVSLAIFLRSQTKSSDILRRLRE